MVLQALEQLRMRKLFKMFLLTISTVMAGTAYLYFERSSVEELSTIVVIIVACILVFACSIPKNFEAEVKRKLVPYLLKNIIKDNGIVRWQQEFDGLEDITFENKIIDKLEKLIDSKCLASNSMVDKESQKYNIRLALLKTINNDSQENSIKIQYLKKANEEYEEEQERQRLFAKTENLTPEENDRLNYLIEKRLEDFELSQAKAEKLFSVAGRNLCLFEVFKFVASSDDMFSGNYKGIDFLAIETINNKRFSGTVIRIPLKEQFDNVLLVSQKGPLAAVKPVIINASKLNQIQLGAFRKHNVWVEKTDDVSNVITQKFVNYVNRSNNNFAYLFKYEYAYLIWPHSKDLFKIGSLFKRVDDKKQYETFEKDVRKMLAELERFANSLL